MRRPCASVRSRTWSPATSREQRYLAVRLGTVGGMEPRDAMPSDDDHRRPHGVSDATVAAAGKLSEALEWVERARGHLYSFHQLIGRADFLAEEAADELAQAGHAEHADRVRAEIIGRNVLAGRWSFQVVEDFDDGYWQALRDVEREVRDALLDGRRHVYEAELKEQRRSRGRPRHESRPTGEDAA
jgi:DNA-binding transcriptional MocR family regulator